MAETQTDSTGLAATFKRVYGNKITELYTHHDMTWNQFKKSSRKAEFRPGGEGYYFSTRQSDLQDIGGRAEGAFLPEAFPNDGVQGFIKPKSIYGSMNMSGLAIETGKGNMAAFVESLGDQTMLLFKSMTSDMNRQCWGDGYGLIGTSSAAATPATGTTYTVTFANDRGVRYFKKGMICDVYNSTAIDVTVPSPRVLSINPATQVVTFEANAASSLYDTYHPISAARSYTGTNATISAGSFWVRQGARLASHATSDASFELTGLNGMYDDGDLIATFEGIVVANDPEWKANIMDNGQVNRELSIDLMLAAIDMTAARSSVSADIIRLGLGLRRKYFGLLAPDIRFAPAVLKGGYEHLDFSQNSVVKMVVDPMTQPNRMYFEPNGCIKRYELTPIGWGGFDPNRMHWKANYDVADLYLRTYCNLGVEGRNELTLLDDLTEPSSAPW